MNRISSCLAASAMLAFVPLAANAFTLTSADVKPGGTIAAAYVYKGFGCTGDNVSPSLMWKDAPAGTKSFAVTVYDPDAPTGSGWWHWVVFNLPASTHALPKGAGDIGGSGMPAGAVQSRTDFGTPGYGGPCPPQGDRPHHYVFTVYALKTDKLDADANASGAMIGFMLHFNTIAKASFTARYGRK
jgi:Raf kinase inhibitor-like YbhB/YbcL family protein